MVLGYNIIELCWKKKWKKITYVNNDNLIKIIRNKLSCSRLHGDHIDTKSIYSPRLEEHTLLILYEDLCTARASLPKFSGTRVKDPGQFLANTESVLRQANIHISGWCRSVGPQLKGTGATWWRSIKVLDLSWDEFRVEFLQNFDNDGIRLQLRTDILCTLQYSLQSLAEFILQKNQLARRVNAGLFETDQIHIIAGLTREPFRMHIRLHRPSAFLELRSIANILDPGTSATTPYPTRDKPSQGKQGVTERHKSPSKSKSNFSNAN